MICSQVNPIIFFYYLLFYTSNINKRKHSKNWKFEKNIRTIILQFIFELKYLSVGDIKNIIKFQEFILLPCHVMGWDDIVYIY
jgi:hypothetical protein